MAIVLHDATAARQPWERTPYEGRRVFDYARTYFELGRDRSLPRLRVGQVALGDPRSAWDENEYRRELEEQDQQRKDFRECEARLGDLRITSGVKALIGDGATQPAMPTFADGVRAISQGRRDREL